MLVACSVEKGKGQSERGSRHRAHDDEKVSAQRFAAEAGTSADRVLRYLDAWEKAADDGRVPHAADLDPTSVRGPDGPRSSRVPGVCEGG